MPEFLYIIHVYRETEEVKSLKNENVFDNNNTKTKLTTATTVHLFHTVGINYYRNVHHMIHKPMIAQFCTNI